MERLFSAGMWVFRRLNQKLWIWAIFWRRPGIWTDQRRPMPLEWEVKCCDSM